MLGLSAKQCFVLNLFLKSLQESAVAELMETDQEVSSSADDVIMKNLKVGMQAEQGNDVFTANLKRILETASGKFASAV